MKTCNLQLNDLATASLTISISNIHVVSTLHNWSEWQLIITSAVSKPPNEEMYIHSEPEKNVAVYSW